MVLEHFPDSMVDLSSAICGCGNPDMAFHGVTYILTWAASDKRGEGPFEEMFKAPYTYLAIALLNHLELIEHGGGIGGSWITDKGKEVLAFLTEHGDDWDDTGVFITNDDVHYGNMDLM